MDKRRGSLEVFYGCMFSGKTDELICEIGRAEIGRKKVVAFKHELDLKRNPAHTLRSHSGLESPAHVVKEPAEVFRIACQTEADVVVFDEVQFFGDDQGAELESVLETLAFLGKRVIIGGLNTDFRGQPFNVVARLIALARVARPLYAVCTVCGDEMATRSQRLINGKAAPYDSPLIDVGGEEKYQARCRVCHEVPGKPISQLKFGK